MHLSTLLLGGLPSVSTQSAEWITAARVLRRIGFGVRGSEVDSAVKLGPAPSYVSKIVGADFMNDPGVVATPIPELDVPERPEGADVPGRRRYLAKAGEQRRELTHWWIRRMAAASNPANEKLTFLWHNHFATSALKVGAAESMANQNQKLRKLCLGDFRTLAYAMLTDAAMVIWLDGQQNKSGSPNENLAREFLELFALGHGNGYSERDVREGARALTGWTVREYVDAELVAKRHDNSLKTVLGTSGNIGSEEFCDIVVAQPESAIYIASKLWRQLASDTPPSENTLRRLVKAYGPDRDLRGLTEAILSDPDFLDSSATVVSGPVDWLIGLLRAVQVPMDNNELVKVVAATLKSLGQQPFNPPDVGGWPFGQAWLSSSAVNIRLRMAGEVIKRGDVSLVAETPVSDRLDAAGYLIGVGAWSERSAMALKPLCKDPTTLVAAAVNTPEYLTS
ncbi:DUF1800 domain-containing protein [Mycolicibacterium litorale]|uniref:DUF1800 domain-containing protein n=1 Tax=Mycolicibacterium litorale TaxID=758802 RepID=UPI002E293184|nr:DUF1800 domain-containing protein [Mycolicibacterium litorale]